VIHKRIVEHIVSLREHFIPHKHTEAEERHKAHGLSLVSLFAYLLIFAVSVSLVYLVRIKAPHILGVASYSSSQIISLTNQKREENGLSDLTENNLLAQAAAAKAADMIAVDYWAHNSPSGKTPWSFINAVGYKYVFAGENLARDFGDPGSVVNAWMNSPSHRSNLLDKNFKEIGVAVSSAKLSGHEGILVVQMFGSAISGVQENNPVVAASPLPSSTPIALKASPNPALPQAPISGAVAQAPTTDNTQKSVIAEQKQALSGQQASVLGGRQFSITKGISLALVSFVFLLFALEVMFTLKHERLELRSGVLAHLGILALVLFALWYAVGGAIL